MTQTLTTSPAVVEKILEHFNVQTALRPNDKQFVFDNMRGYFSALYAFDIINADEYMELTLCLLHWLDGGVFITKEVF